jgi:hypothetical protein
MPSVVKLAEWEGIILAAGLCGAVVWKLFTGEISLDYLLYGDARNQPSPFFSPGRAQMLMFTVISAVYFLLQVISHPANFPEVPNGLIGLLAASHAVYLGGKAQNLYLGRFRDFGDSLMGRKP